MRGKKSKVLSMNEDEPVFDQSVILTFDSVYKRFISKNDNIDVFDGMTRSEYRTLYSNLLKTKPDEAKRKLRALKARPKTVPTNTLSEHIENPFDVLGFSEKTEIQKKVATHSEWVDFYGNYAYSCSCGAGKTLAGVYLMYKKQCKTLIISSRNAVNDQWKTIIEEAYPNLTIYTKDGYYRNKKCIAKASSVKNSLSSSSLVPDVYIFSPQYLIKHLDIDISPGLVIYDEVHSLLSKQFINVLLLPLINVIENRWNELPYMMALSATYPSQSTWQGKEAIKRIKKLFGSIYSTPSTITEIPVKVWDYRDHFERRDREGNTLTNNDARGGMFDSYYKSPSDYEVINFFYNKILEDEEIVICPEYKGIVMTDLINSSVYAALHAHKIWNCNVVLVRAADECSYYFEKDKNSDFKFDVTVSLSDIVGVGKACDYKNVVDKCSIIVGTYHRLKEGFSVQNITWGICTKFPYNTIPRIQILGRIRRSSNDEALNRHERIFYVCSGKIPSTLGNPYYKGKHRILYDFKFEENLFKMENCIRLKDDENEM